MNIFTLRDQSTIEALTALVSPQATNIERAGFAVLGVVINALDALTAREFLLLRHLIENRGVVQSRNVLLKAVWNYDAALTTKTLDVHIAWLRQKLEEEPSRPKHIVTVRGLGYKFVA